MKKTNKIILTVFIIAILLLGIGYAAIQNITLNITGTATADPNQANFKVMFSGTPIVSNSEYITAAITDDINATISVNGLTTEGQMVTAEFTVQNASSDLSTDLSVTTTNSNTEYFILSSEINKSSLIAGEATIVKVNVELAKTPLAGRVESTIGVQLVATPVEPGKEGSSGSTNNFSQTPVYTLDLLTNDDIGDFIDLGNNIVRTESTSDDWRILYKDESRLYVILADYLPNSTNYATKALLDTSNTYNVYSQNSRAHLIDGFENENAWKELANGFENIVVTGTPTLELLGRSYTHSYNLTHDTEMEYFDISENILMMGSFDFDNLMANYDLYVPEDEVIDTTSGYWLATEYYEQDNRVFSVNEAGYIYTSESNRTTGTGVRPVLSIPLDYNFTYINGVVSIY